VALGNSRSPRAAGIVARLIAGEAVRGDPILRAAAERARARLDARAGPDLPIAATGSSTPIG
jgi:hypothetical protein